MLYTPGARSRSSSKIPYRLASSCVKGLTLSETISKMCPQLRHRDPKAWPECVFFIYFFPLKLRRGHVRPSHTCTLSRDPGFCCDRPDHHHIFPVGGACIAVSSPRIRLLTGASPSPSNWTVHISPNTAQRFWGTCLAMMWSWKWLSCVNSYQNCYINLSFLICTRTCLIGFSETFSMCNVKITFVEFCVYVCMRFLDFFPTESFIYFL